jgi:hypothetical protein
MTFKDHFSRGYVNYAVYRPVYPDALFTYLSTLVPVHDLAWDCGTGNGQAALGLARHFVRAVATDPSAEQIINAIARPGITYVVSAAERANLASNSVDLISVAQALHWFEFEKFYVEVRRVAKSSGVLAAWCYGLMTIDTAIDEVVTHYYDDIVGLYRPAERRHIERQYRDLPFPFAEIQAPEFFIEQRWTLAQLHGYLWYLVGDAAIRTGQGREPGAMHRRRAAPGLGRSEPAISNTMADFHAHWIDCVRTNDISSSVGVCVMGSQPKKYGAADATCVCPKAQ